MFPSDGNFHSRACQIPGIPAAKVKIDRQSGHGNFPSADSAIFTPEKIGTQGVNLQAQRAINRQFHRIR